MRKSAVSAVVVSLALVLAFTASAQAVSIGVNLAVGSDASSQVSSSLSDGYVAQTNWNNWDGAFLAGPVDSTGAAVTSGLSVGLDLAWGGGWSYYYEYGRVCSATTNSLGRTGWNAQYGPIITLANIPYTNYTVATLVNNGYGTDELSWQVETGQTASSYRTPSYQNGGGSMCAIQIINTGGVATPVLLTSPSTVHLGRIIKGAASPSQNINVNEAGGAATTYAVSAVSNSDFTVADAGNSSVAITAMGHNTHAVTADTSTAGSKSASVTVAGTAVAMDATVLEHANGTFANTTGVLSSGDKVLTLDFGTVAAGTSGGNIDSSFNIYANVVGVATANLDLTGIVGDLSKLTGASTFAGLAAGNNQGYTFHFNTTTPGVLSASYTFNLADEAGVVGGSTDTLTLNVSGIVTFHPGDVNQDGQVGLLDYNVIKANFGASYGSGNHWTDGDVNGDLQVGLLDFNIVKAHFGHTTGDGAAVTAVPEPATMSLLALAGLAALRRKR